MKPESRSIENTHVVSIEAITPPGQLKQEIPNRSTGLIATTRDEIRDILHGRDTKRLLMVVGPCSIHDPQAAIGYAEKLRGVRNQITDEVLVVMRTYFEKPRTTVGWKGLAYNPLLGETSDTGSTGLVVSRQLLADVNNLGLPCAVEFLEPFTPQYFADLVSWGAIGARTVESQVHRQLASGLSMPIGFKNSTEGDNKVAIDAMITAASAHTFYGIDAYGQAAVVKTTGNSDTHLVLRGGNRGINYDESSINEAISLIANRDLLTRDSRPIMIDCSHGNSEKDYRRQPIVLRRVLEQVQMGQYRIMGLMIESNLYPGRQDLIPGQPLRYGISITDACIGWRETEDLLLECARMNRPRTYAVA